MLTGSALAAEIDEIGIAGLKPFIIVSDEVASGKSKVKIQTWILLSIVVVIAFALLHMPPASSSPAKSSVSVAHAPLVAGAVPVVSVASIAKLAEKTADPDTNSHVAAQELRAGTASANPKPGDLLAAAKDPPSPAALRRTRTGRADKTSLSPRDSTAESDGRADAKLEALRRLQSNM
jgi:hypothetical protein